VPGVGRDRLEAMGPIVAAAGKDLDRLIHKMDLHLVAIELDFMKPTIARWHFLDRGGQCRFDKSGVGRLNTARRRFLTLKWHSKKLHATRPSETGTDQIVPAKQRGQWNQSPWPEVCLAAVRFPTSALKGIRDSSQTSRHVRKVPKNEPALRERAARGAEPVAPME
jgi:hypothetical protein